MGTFMETLAVYAAKEPNTAVLFDETHSKGLTYAKIDELSGRVRAYLEAHQIGREDFVLINLPRGITPIIAMIGVWKTGAAWALVEDTYAPDRIEYIRKDCGCKLEINAAAWEEILNTDAVSGYRNAAPHDAAYAIYTSGTTGNPKGVLHEYGNLERAVESIKVNGITPFDGKDRLALLAPMNFVASIIVILKALSIRGGKIFVVGYSTIKNPKALKLFFLEKRISITFLTPSYVRMLGSQTGPFLRMIFVGSEPANHLYYKNLELINIYACSESGFAVGVFRIDKSYEACPIGKPEVDTKIILLKEDGTEAADGETGELCFENPYVRGYINLPDESKKAFVDGIYHTGDLARFDENHNLVLLGRSGDMIKINGNRIEPAEIEAAVKQVLGIDWAAAKGVEANGKSFLCAYYTADVQVDTGKMRTELMRRLPYYMIPSYYLKIDSVPLKANGKLDRAALPVPDASDFQNDYAAPTNETEEKICHAMETVLHLEQVGIHDDFYELGGDSLASIEMLSECGLPGLNASEIFRGRTPEKIAVLYREAIANSDGESADEKNERSMKKEHLLTTEQRYMVDYQFYTPRSTMYNLYSMMRMEKEEFDLPRLAEAMKTAIANHPALLTTIQLNEDGDLVQRYTPDILEDIHVEHISEFDFQNIKDTLVQPYQIVNNRLYRVRVFETEKHGYVFFDVHHILFDGTSLKVLMGDMGKAYMGMPLEKDYYYLMLEEREEQIGSALYEESKRYFEQRFEGTEWSSYPTVDHDTRDNEMGELMVEIGIEQPLMRAAERQYKISRNEFFITAAALAISTYNKKNDIRLSWIYNGREELTMMSTVGLLFRDLPIGLHFKDDMTLRELFSEVHEQVQKGIEHCCYPYVDLFDPVTRDELSDGPKMGAQAAYLLYQQDIRDGGMGGMNIESVDIRQNQAASQTILDMEILDGADGLQLMIDYAASRYEDQSIERFKNLFLRAAHLMVTHNSQADVTVRELKDKITDKKNFFQIITGIFSKKR